MGAIKTIRVLLLFVKSKLNIDQKFSGTSSAAKAIREELSMDTLAGQCDHILGIFLSPHIQDGGMDRLVRVSERADVDQGFAYCPCCGIALSPNGMVINRNSAKYASSMNCDTSVSS